MANTALIGDNHGMFHQVGPIGPFSGQMPLLTPTATLAPVNDGTGDWAITDLSEVVFRAPLDTYRLSVLWKADVYKNAVERDRKKSNTLSMQDVADRFNDDLVRRGSEIRFDLARLDDVALSAELKTVYPEDKPVGALRSVFDAA
jgi:hypothetical protein